MRNPFTFGAHFGVLGKRLVSPGFGGPH